MSPRSLWVFVPLSFLIAISLVLPTARADFQSCSTSDKTIWLPLGNCDIPLQWMATVHSWGALIGVAKEATSNAANQYCFSPSTVMNDTFVMATEICQGANNLNHTSVEQCRSRRGNLIDRTMLGPANVGALGSNDGWKGFQDPLPAFQYAASVVMSLTSSTVGMLVGIVTESVNSNQPQLGLAGNSSIIKALKNNGSINARVWGLNSGSISEQPRRGSLVFGGFDKSSITSTPVEIPITAYPERLGTRYCPLQVKVYQIDLVVTTEAGVKNTTMISEPSRQVSFCLEPNDHLPRLPGSLGADLLRNLKDLVNITTTPSNTLKDDTKSDFYILEPGLSFPSSLNTFNLSLKITLATGSDDRFVVDVPDHEMKRPLTGLAKDGSIIVDTNHTELSIFSQTNVQDAGSFGRSVLSQIYLVVDQDVKKFYLSHQNMDANIPQPVAWTCDPDDSLITIKKSERIGLIAWSVIGVFLGAGLYFLIWKCWGRHKECKMLREGRLGIPATDDHPDNRARVDPGGGVREGLPPN